MSTPSTVLHRGYIVRELVKVQASERYTTAEAVLHEWAHMDPESLLDRPQRVVWALAEMKAMKLEAFTRAGQIYRLALAEYDRYHAAWPMGRPPKPYPQTAIQYVDPPVGMAPIDFTQGEWPWVL